ncbi:MAG: TetR/AcrR family transcriptional regulator [Bacteroidales bacterium]|nr:TetR/AcrR family transcriptional regulator [Bacteroidales bacterium]
MYQIRDDKRTRKSAALLTEGLLKCLRDKSFNEVGISDICQAGGVSRTTFYRLFDTPADVLAYACDSLAEESLKICGKPGNHDREPKLVRFISLLMENCELLSAIVKCNRREIIENSFSHYCSADNFQGDAGNGYFPVINGAIITSMLFKWERDGKRESAEELYSIYREFLSTQLEKI